MMPSGLDEGADDWTDGNHSEPVPVLAEPRTLMQLTFESQRTQLDRLDEELRAKVSGA